MHRKPSGAIAAGFAGKGFTLIELLIVVAIIAILAAIAVPNFLEAQTRAKVSRVKADMRSLATCAEAYYVDWNHYPISGQYVGGGPGTINPPSFNNRFRGITTPVSYITSLPVDVFFQQGGVFPLTPGQPATFEYNDFTTAIPSEKLANCVTFNIAATRASYTAYYGDRGQVSWAMQSPGPDKKNDFQQLGGSPKIPVAGALQLGANQTYDPTNGTISRGDIARTNAQQRN